MRVPSKLKKSKIEGKKSLKLEKEDQFVLIKEITLNEDLKKDFQHVEKCNIRNIF